MGPVTWSPRGCLAPPCPLPHSHITPAPHLALCRQSLASRKQGGLLTRISQLPPLPGGVGGLHFPLSRVPVCSLELGHLACLCLNPSLCPSSWALVNHYYFLALSAILTPHYLQTQTSSSFILKSPQTPAIPSGDSLRSLLPWSPDSLSSHRIATGSRLPPRVMPSFISALFR